MNNLQNMEFMGLGCLEGGGGGIFVIVDEMRNSNNFVWHIYISDMVMGGDYVWCVNEISSCWECRDKSPIHVPWYPPPPPCQVMDQE